MPANRNNLLWNATVKAYPAISDLQAISGFVRVWDHPDDVGAGDYIQDVYTVPVGKIFVMEYLSATCSQVDPTGLAFCVRSGGTNYFYYSAAYGGAGEKHEWTLPIKFDEDEIVRIYWYSCLATTDVRATVFGYLIDKY